MVPSPTAMPDFPGICDCHTHVFSPDTETYPFDPARTYTPPAASLDALVEMHERCGIERAVIVQPSPYGDDNSCQMDAVEALRSRGREARAVVVVAPDIRREALRMLHARGARGVRVNLETAGESRPEAAAGALQTMADLAEPMGWHVQTYTNPGVLSALESLVARLPVPLVIDHFGKADAALGPQDAGFRTLLRLVESGNIYVKLSAPYRISKKPDYEDASALVRELVEARPDRMLWGTDWPHPGAAGGSRKPPIEITPSRNEDNARALARFAEWVGDIDIMRKILVENPARLYGF